MFLICPICEAKCEQNSNGKCYCIACNFTFWQGDKGEVRGAGILSDENRAKLVSKMKQLLRGG